MSLLILPNDMLSIAYLKYTRYTFLSFFTVINLHLIIYMWTSFGSKISLSYFVGKRQDCHILKYIATCTLYHIPNMKGSNCFCKSKKRKRKLKPKNIMAKSRKHLGNSGQQNRGYSYFCCPCLVKRNVIHL